MKCWELLAAAHSSSHFILAESALLQNLELPRFCISHNTTRKPPGDPHAERIETTDTRARTLILLTTHLFPRRRRRAPVRPTAFIDRYKRSAAGCSVRFSHRGRKQGIK
jgi:hypothetical protein